VFDPFDGAAFGVDNDPEWGVSALIPIIAYSVHIPIRRYRQKRYHHHYNQ
jgi:hypothetical protein